MALLTELEFMPSSHYRNVAPDGACNERQGIGGVPWHHEPPSVVGVSSRAGDASPPEEWEARISGHGPSCLLPSFLSCATVLGE